MCRFCMLESSLKACVCMRRVVELWCRILLRLRGHDPRGDYEAVHPHHSTVQMSHIDGISAAHSSLDAPKVEGQEVVQVRAEAYPEVCQSRNVSSDHIAQLLQEDAVLRTARWRLLRWRGKGSCRCASRGPSDLQQLIRWCSTALAFCTAK